MSTDAARESDATAAAPAGDLPPPTSPGAVSSPSESGDDVSSESPAQAPMEAEQDPARKAQAEQKAADSLKRFSYLLGQTELFQHFINLKKERDPSFAALVHQAASLPKGKGKKGSGSNTHGDTRRRKTEKEEDAELLEEEEDCYVFESSPSYVQGQLRPYQIDGLNWLVSLFHHGINGILADEMGLGKTLQTISFLGYLKHVVNIPRFYLVIVPKSTLDNWRREFAKWVPGFDTCVLTGTREERAETIRTRLLVGKFDVLITTYEVCLREKSTLQKIHWEYLVIDEAHRIKNAGSQLAQIVRSFDSRGRLLITGTPLQNNLLELWSLLNFLLPDIFSSEEDFHAWFSEGKDEEGVVQQLHKVLRPFLLRRVKADVEKSLLPKKEVNLYVGMTDMQRKWYKALLEKDIDAVNGSVGKKEGKTRLLNIVMQLRKCCNHPYLFDGAEPGPPYTTDEHLVQNAGKMLVLDQLLKHLKAKGSRVLIFSQMSRMLDILEDYCFLRDYEYSRIDGSTAHEDRIAAIDEYNAPDSSKFVFLLTTRAGGLGINLTSADVVVLFDSDWNPQADLQAMDRAHRIGQTKQVHVYRLVTEHAVEERVLERAQQKLRLDQLVIQQGRQQPKGQSKDDLVDMIQHGAERIIRSDAPMLAAGTSAGEGGAGEGDAGIEAIIAEGEKRTLALQERYSHLGLDALNNLQEGGTYEWEGQSFRPGERKPLWIEPGKRERHINYNIDGYYRQITGVPQRQGHRPPRPPGWVTLNDWQFFPARLEELQEKDLLAYQRSVGYVPPLRAPKDGESEDDVQAEQKLEVEKIQSAEPLTEEEQEEKASLLMDGFSSWSKRDFNYFLRACERFGRGAYREMARDWLDGEGGKTEAEIRAYARTFFSRGPQELEGWDKYVARIDEAAARRKKVAAQEKALRTRMANLSDPMTELELPYASGTSHYSEKEDKFLLIRLAAHGLVDGVYDVIRTEILADPLFRFDWFFKTRTSAELARRGGMLLGLLEGKRKREREDSSTPSRSSRSTRTKRQR